MHATQYTDVISVKYVRNSKYLQLRNQLSLDQLLMKSSKRKQRHSNPPVDQICGEPIVSAVCSSTPALISQSIFLKVTTKLNARMSFQSGTIKQRKFS